MALQMLAELVHRDNVEEGTKVKGEALIGEVKMMTRILWEDT